MAATLAHARTRWRWICVATSGTKRLSRPRRGIVQSFGRRREGGTSNSSNGFCLCVRPRQEQAPWQVNVTQQCVHFQSGSASRFGRAVGGSLAGGDAFAWSRIPSRNAAASSSLIQPSISTLPSYCCARERSRDPPSVWPAEPPAWDAAGQVRVSVSCGHYAAPECIYLAHLASSRSPGPLAEPRAVGRLEALLPGACSTSTRRVSKAGHFPQLHRRPRVTAAPSSAAHVSTPKALAARRRLVLHHPRRVPGGRDPSRQRRRLRTQTAATAAAQDEGRHALLPAPSPRRSASASPDPAATAAAGCQPPPFRAHVCAVRFGKLARDSEARARIPDSCRQSRASS